MDFIKYLKASLPPRIPKKEDIYHFIPSKFLKRSKLQELKMPLKESKITCNEYRETIRKIENGEIELIFFDGPFLTEEEEKIHREILYLKFKKEMEDKLNGISNSRRSRPTIKM